MTLISKMRTIVLICQKGYVYNIDELHIAGSSTGSTTSIDEYTISDHYRK